MDTYSNEAAHSAQTIDLNGSAIAELAESAEAFICAAGFEARAKRVPFSLRQVRNPLVIRYVGGPRENERVFKEFEQRFVQVPGFEVCPLDMTRLESFESCLSDAFAKHSNVGLSHVLLDISGMPNFAICILIVRIRQLFPASRLTLLYTEAEEYYPRQADFKKIKAAAKRSGTKILPGYLSNRAVTMFIPELFSGVTLGQHDTCLIVFAGYEPHRTNCMMEASNPSKLVMVYGEPERPDLKWRVELSQLMHRGIDSQVSKTERVTPTYSVNGNVELILGFYEHLYDDHAICCCPTNSKIQAVAAALAWERYPDIQLAFPIPTEYLPKRFSVDWRDTFRIDLGLPPKASQLFR